MGFTYASVLESFPKITSEQIWTGNSTSVTTVTNVHFGDGLKVVQELVAVWNNDKLHIINQPNGCSSSAEVGWCAL